MKMFLTEKTTIALSFVFLVDLINNEVLGGTIGQFFISSPKNVTVNSGEHARLICKVGNMVGKCQWTRNGFALGSDRDMTGYPRYIMGGTQENDCDLVIAPVLSVDEGSYQCQVSGGNGVASIISEKVELKVNSEPGHPYIIQRKERGIMEVEVGEEVKLECESQGGRPPAEIQWWEWSWRG